eukprot:TRINITY_DN400_c0_g1_i1.p2 TRINITY_DN400_c0_g1~~TRINITY_DN400_c0_g1_i1.p2  ORF type:complete len:475 (-),score=71.66 TRINITY_DN400_c0_g1_i1:717-2141(-)
MYNGVGLLTPRGTGTSGYVQSNQFNLRRRPPPAGSQGKPGEVKKRKEGQQKANEEILEHNRKREIEVKLLELRESLEEQGYSEEEIEKELSSMREEMMRKAEEQVEPTEADLAEETHAIAARKQAQMEKLRDALGLGDVKEGEAFDQELQEEKRQARIKEREDREAQKKQEEKERQRKLRKQKREMKQMQKELEKEKRKIAKKKMALKRSQENVQDDAEEKDKQDKSKRKRRKSSSSTSSSSDTSSSSGDSGSTTSSASSSSSEDSGDDRRTKRHQIQRESPPRNQRRQQLDANVEAERRKLSRLTHENEEHRQQSQQQQQQSQSRGPRRSRFDQMEIPSRQPNESQYEKYDQYRDIQQKRVSRDNYSREPGYNKECERDRQVDRDKAEFYRSYGASPFCLYSVLLVFFFHKNSKSKQQNGLCYVNQLIQQNCSPNIYSQAFFYHCKCGRKTCLAPRHYYSRIFEPKFARRLWI